MLLQILDTWSLRLHVESNKTPRLPMLMPICWFWPVLLRVVITISYVLSSFSFKRLYIYIYVYIYIYIYPGKTGTLFPLLMGSLWYVQIIGYIMACKSCLFVCLQTTLYHSRHYVALSEGINTKMLVKYMLSSVCLRFSQFSQLSFIWYMGPFIFGLASSHEIIVRMCTLSYYHIQTGSMNH